MYIKYKTPETRSTTYMEFEIVKLLYNEHFIKSYSPIVIAFIIAKVTLMVEVANMSFLSSLFKRFKIYDDEKMNYWHCTAKWSNKVF